MAIELENILGVRSSPTDNADDDPDTPRKPASLKVLTRVKNITPAKRRAPPISLSPEEKERRQENRLARQIALAEVRKRINVGIDLGTTYSGIAYVSSSSEKHPKTAKDVEVITKWTGGQSALLEKVPTRIAYAFENDFDKDLWGYDVKPGSMVCCQWFKLLLDAAETTTGFDDPLLAKCVGDGILRIPDSKTPQEVVADFLAMLYDHTIRQLKSMMGAVAVEQTPILFELTLPATWSHAARDATRTAAIDAGFDSRPRDTVVLIDEPECAAIAAMKSTIEAFPDNTAFQRGHSVLICDLGGVITYRIAKVDPLNLEECCVGEGGKCGSTSIDRAFWEFLGRKFGTSFKDLPIKKTTSGSLLMSTFEDIKRDFKGRHEGEQTYEVPLRMKIKLEDHEHLAQWYDEDEGMVRFNSEDLEQMFEPTMKRVFKLVREQIKRTKKAKMPPIRTLVLCGGLGSSAYVKDRFEQFVHDSLSGKAEVISPKRPWSAIAVGAAIRALEKPSVLFRRARDHIGIVVHEPFDSEKHREEDYYDCPMEGPRARHQMRWSVERGEKIKPNMKKVIKDVYIGIEKADLSKPVIVYQDFYLCSEDDAPARLDEETCLKAGRIRMDLTNIVLEERKKLDKLNNVKQEKTAKKDPKARSESAEIDIKIELTCGSDKGILEVCAKVGLRRVGQCQIEYFADPESGN